MILLGLLSLWALIAPDLGGMLAGFLVSAMALGLAGAALAGMEKARRIPAWGWGRIAGWLLVEELAAVAVGAGPYPEQLDRGGHGPVFAGAAILALGLTLRMPLPEFLFPVRGRWLRRLLAAGALAGFVFSGPWRYSWEYLWTSRQGGLPLQGALLLGLAMAAWYLFQGCCSLADGLSPREVWARVRRLAAARRGPALTRQPPA